jgi:hypothetical protein
MSESPAHWLRPDGQRSESLCIPQWPGKDKTVKTRRISPVCPGYPRGGGGGGGVSNDWCIRAFQIMYTYSKAEKSNTSAKGFLGIANKLMNFLAISRSLSHSYSTFPLCLGTTLIEIAVCLKPRCFTTYFHIKIKVNFVCFLVLSNSYLFYKHWLL